MANEIKEKPVFQDWPIFENPELIKVKVIKDKYVEQIPKAMLVDLQDADLLGVVRDTWVLFRKPTGALYKVHAMDVLQYLKEKFIEGNGGKASQEMYAWAQAELEKTPKIFAE